MKEYDLIVVGTGSAMNYIDQIISMNPSIKIAVIDKDEPGGICLTRACIPSKLLLYPADLVRTIGTAGKFGISAKMKSADFGRIMERMRAIISEDIGMIRKGLSESPNIDYYSQVAEFVSPYTLRVGREKLSSRMIFLCTGSKPGIPAIPGLADAGYQTSDTLLKMTKLPESIAIIGGGYVAAEYGHFFSSMGSAVTIIEKNPMLLHNEEPEISALAKREFSRHMSILTNHEVARVERSGNKKRIIARGVNSGKEVAVTADEILVAAGRASNADILHPEKGGIKTDEKGWILVNEYLETSRPNVWALGDADGKYLFTHVGNYESGVVFYNAVLKRMIKADYHAVPRAVFSYPEIAAVGMGEKEAVEKHGEENILIGFQKYEDSAKGMIMDAKDCFVKAIVERDAGRILGAHIIGPHASILIHEIINLMYTPEQSINPIIKGMHIHPSLNEVIDRAFGSLMPVERYHHILKDMHLE